jgi:hypothetical protein
MAIKNIFEGVINGTQYYARVFTVNPKNRVNNRADLPYAMAIPSAFPLKPESIDDYTLYRTYTSTYGTHTFEAPEDGWYKIIVYGASGNGGDGDERSKDEVGAFAAGGGGGGGGGVCITIAKLNKGDTVIITVGSVGSTSKAMINATAGETYSQMTVTPALDGDDGDTYTGGYFGDSYARGGNGGEGGEASGGKYANYSGKRGGRGEEDSSDDSSDHVSAEGGSGGDPGYTGGRKGGKGGPENSSGDSGSAGYVQIYRGNTNIVA